MVQMALHDEVYQSNRATIGQNVRNTIWVPRSAIRDEYQELHQR